MIALALKKKILKKYSYGTSLVIWKWRLHGSTLGGMFPGEETKTPHTLKTGKIKNK